MQKYFLPLSILIWRRKEILQHNQVTWRLYLNPKESPWIFSSFVFRYRSKSGFKFWPYYYCPGVWLVCFVTNHSQILSGSLKKLFCHLTVTVDQKLETSLARQAPDVKQVQSDSMTGLKGQKGTGVAGGWPGTPLFLPFSLPFLFLSQQSVISSFTRWPLIPTYHELPQSPVSSSQWDWLLAAQGSSPSDQSECRSFFFFYLVLEVTQCYFWHILLFFMPVSTPSTFKQRR